MKSEELLDAIGNIDPKFIEEAEVEKGFGRGRRIKLYRSFAAAACFLLVVGGVTYYSRNLNGGDKSTSTNLPNEEVMENGCSAPAVIYYNGAEYERVLENDKFTAIHQETAVEREKLGNLGEKGSNLYADNGLTGATVYQVGENELEVEFSDEQYVYKKR